MGSGKGKSRRAHSSSDPITVVPIPDIDAAPVVATYERQHWEDFLQNSGLGNIRMLPYYFKDAPTTVTAKVFNHPVSLTDSEYEKAYTELFRDAVEVQAISFSGPYDVED